LTSLIEDLVEETIDTLKEVINDAGLSKGDINEIVMVGGSTRVPLVQQKVKNFFGKELNKSVNPDEVSELWCINSGWSSLRGDVQRCPTSRCYTT